MPHDRFYTDLPLATGQRVELHEEEAHHLIRVMRATVGNTVELVNGRGCLAQASIAQIMRHSCELLITLTTEEPPDPFRIIMAQAIPRINRLDLLVEKCTELGMSELWLFPGERSERKELSNQQQQRLKAITIAAMKQCGRLYLPKITFKPKLVDWQQLELPSFYGAVEGETPLFSTAWAQQRPSKGVLFFIGPEAGLTAIETAHLKALGAIGISLHRHVLRTDTAPLVALSLIYHWIKEPLPCKQGLSRDPG